MKNLFKNQILQKTIMWSFLVITALVCAFTLAYSTNFWLFDAGNVNRTYSAQYMNDYQNVTTWTAESVRPLTDAYKNFMGNLNGANNYLFLSQVVILCLFAVMCILGNKYRKKYYISNLVIGVSAPIIAIVLCVVGIVKNNKIIADFDDVKLYLEAVKAYNKADITLNTNYQLIMMILLIIEIVFYLVFAAYTVLKYVMLRSNDEAETNLEVTDEISLDSVKEAE